MQSQNTVIYAGVDVAKATLQLHWQGQQREFSNTPKGFLQLVAQLQTVPSVQVVCEATGGYERALVKVLHQGQIPVSVTNPARVRAAAQAQGQRAKTDRIDARMLTEYGQRYQPKATPPVSATQDQLVDLAQWLKQLIHGQALAKTQAEHHQDLFVRRQHAKLMTHLEAQVEAVEKQIEHLLEKDAALQQRVTCLGTRPIITRLSSALG
jgi:transposase